MRKTATLRRRYDPVFQYHVVFNGKNGNKIRYTTLNKPKPVRASAPELLDIKINDYCPFGCPQCYQGSTPQGGHSSLKNIQHIADLAAQAGVFEVALGGGEPTLHPEFINILKAFDERGIVPNFTTRNPRYLKEHWSELHGLMGGFAVSVDNAKMVNNLAEIIKGCPREPGEVNLHVIMGLISEEDFCGVLNEASKHEFRVTLLGFKQIGRGENYQPHEHSWWLKHVLESKVDISIDTALALQWEQEILAAGIPKTMFHTTEGHFSAYIDGVNMTLHPSSYEPGQSHALTAEWQRDFMRFAGDLSIEEEQRWQETKK